MAVTPMVAGNPLISVGSGPVHMPGAGLVGIPLVYFNGFALNLGPSDASLLVMVDGQPQVKLAMSFTTAKTLSSYLVELIEKLETATDHVIMKTDEVASGLKKMEPGQTRHGA